MKSQGYVKLNRSGVRELFWKADTALCLAFRAARLYAPHGLPGESARLKDIKYDISGCQM